MEDILPGDLVDQLCALHLEGEENWEDILLKGHNQGGGHGRPPRERWTSGFSRILSGVCCAFLKTFSRCWMTWWTGSVTAKICRILFTCMCMRYRTH